MPERQTPDNEQVSATVVLMAIVALFAILAGVVVALEIDDSPNTMAILAILGTGMVGVFIAQLMSLVQGRKTDEKVDRIHSAVNGELDARMRMALAAVMDERDRTLDKRIEAVVMRVLETHVVSCKPPDKEPR